MVHCAVAVDSEIRRENFKRWCHSLTPDGLFSPTAVAQRLGKTASQWSDLYYGRKSFGEKIARNIEEAAGLPRLSLDEPDGESGEVISRETAAALAKLNPTERLRAENVMRALLGLPQLGIEHGDGPSRKQRRAG